MTYIAATPARKPPIAQPDVRPPGARRATYRPTSTTTSSAGARRAAKNSTVSTSVDA